MVEGGWGEGEALEHQLRFDLQCTHKLHARCTHAHTHTHTHTQTHTHKQFIPKVFQTELPVVNPGKFSPWMCLKWKHTHTSIYRARERVI